MILQIGPGLIMHRVVCIGRQDSWITRKWNVLSQVGHTELHNNYKNTRRESRWSWGVNRILVDELGSREVSDPSDLFIGRYKDLPGKTPDLVDSKCMAVFLEGAAFKVCALHSETFLLGASGKALSRYNYLDHLIGWGIFPPLWLSIFLFLALPSLPPLCPCVYRETGSFCLGLTYSEMISPTFLHPPNPFLVLFRGNKWNIGEPVFLYASCSRCHRRWIMVWLLHSIWTFYLIDHLDTWFVDKIKKLPSDFGFQLRQSSLYQAVLQRATIKVERNTKTPAFSHQKAVERVRIWWVMSPK